MKSISYRQGIINETETSINQIYEADNDKTMNFSRLSEELTLLPQLLLRFGFDKKSRPMNPVTDACGNSAIIRKCISGGSFNSRQQTQQKQSRRQMRFAFLPLLAIFMIQSANAAPHHHAQSHPNAQKQFTLESEPLSRFFVKRAKANDGLREALGSRPFGESALEPVGETETDGTIDDIQAPELARFDDAVFYSNNAGGMRPMLPDKWSNLFLTHQQRSFFPTAYGGSGYGSNNGFSAFNGNGGVFNGGMEKRRRGFDDTPQQHFVDNYVNLVEPGRLEWNFNRL